MADSKFDMIGFKKQLLNPELDQNQYRELAKTLETLIDEGTLAGFSAVEERDDIIDVFIEVTVSRNDLEAEDLYPIISLYDFVEDEENECDEELGQDLSLFLISKRVKSIVKRAVSNGKCIELAEVFNISGQGE